MAKKKEDKIQKPFRISLKLGEGKSPHLYLVQLQKIMADDKSLHPMMARTLKMLKKTRTPFILLATIREVVIDPINFRHFDRSVDPRGDWICTLWSDTEIKEHLNNPDGHIKSILKLFMELGYDLYDSKTISKEYLTSLEELTRDQIEAQLKGRELEQE
jgi:hypothetical protein